MSRRPMMLEYRGKIKSLDEWSEIVGINKNAIWLRLKNCGWLVEDALEIPLGGRNAIASWHRRVDRAVETTQEMMIARGYFSKDHRTKIYKQLNGWYKEFRAQDMKAA